MRQSGTSAWGSVAISLAASQRQASNERRNVRTFYASCEYENEAEPGEYAAITIIGDDDGPHIVFSMGDVVILDLPIPACEALAISFALSRAGKHAIIASEHLTERLADLRADTRAEPQHAAPTPESGMTPYGRREIDAPREARGEPESAGLPHKHVDHSADYTRALPVTPPWLRPPDAVRAPLLPDRRSA